MHKVGHGQVNKKIKEISYTTINNVMSFTSLTKFVIPELEDFSESHILS